MEINDRYLIVSYLRYWRKQTGVTIHNGSEKGILAGTHWPIVELRNGGLYTIYIEGEHQRALAAQVKLMPVATQQPGHQLQLF